MTLPLARLSITWREESTMQLPDRCCAEVDDGVVCYATAVVRVVADASPTSLWDTHYHMYVRMPLCHRHAEKLAWSRGLAKDTYTKEVGK